jgi:hypothetical protein
VCLRNAAVGERRGATVRRGRIFCRRAGIHQEELVVATTRELIRLHEEAERGVPWKKWGPYLSERQWGTVREDYSLTGDAWDSFSHDQSRSRTYRWGEDGLAGISDDKQRLCFAMALWNGVDPILKERLFGLTNCEGNHGEDVKEYYFYLDSTPTHSYMKYLYKYPQRAFPYTDLVTGNQRRNKQQPEYELIDTGVFDDDRYFDVFVEYAKASPEDLLIVITVCNRGPDTAPLHVLPTLWFRNTWFAGSDARKPALQALRGTPRSTIAASHGELGTLYLYCDAEVPLLFTDNETNPDRLPAAPRRSIYCKDGIHERVVHGRTAAVNPRQTGTKAAAQYVLSLPAGGEHVIRLRLCIHPPGQSERRRSDPIGDHFDAIVAERRYDADEFYDSVIPGSLDDDERHVMRQALAGMLWTKQYYHLDLDTWIREHADGCVRNLDWFHMTNDDVISMPDKWEYPWFAAWDLAFHAVPLAMVDCGFAKRQLSLLLNEQYQHPNGQLPACEWNFSDVNPPVHAWATLYVYNLEKESKGAGDLRFLEQSFHKLLMNFTWWVNRKDRTGRDVFEGGFLGLDNIGVFDRSQPLPGGGCVEQADGTAWMALFCQNMLDISLELAMHNPVHEQLAYKFIEHYFWIAAAMDRVGDNHDELWDEEDGFFYDVLRLPDGRATRLKVRSMVGLLPLCATTVIEPDALARFPSLLERAHRFMTRRPTLRQTVAPAPPRYRNRALLSVLDEAKLRRVLSRLLDENEFLGPYGIRALSRAHGEHPYELEVGGQCYSVGYEPAESSTGMFGGNANWRGPVWMPVNVLILRALLQYYMYFGDEFIIECPTGSGRLMTLGEVATEIGRRLRRTFLRDEHGRRPVFGGTEKFQTDPHWRDHVLFYEYFHGDNGAGIGASHQTGWTGLIARVMQMGGLLTLEDVLELGRGASAVSGAALPEAPISTTA